MFRLKLEDVRTLLGTLASDKSTRSRMQMEASRSILIPDGESDLALRVLRCLAEVRHFKVAILSRDARAAIRFSRHCHRFLTHTVDGFNRERIEAIKEAAKQVQADIIIPAGLASIRMIAEYKGELAAVATIPPTASVHMLDAFSDKLLFAQLLEQHGIPYPKIQQLDGGTFRENPIAAIKFPVLVKPRNLEAGSGIRLCHSPTQVEKYLASHDDPHNFFVQEFVQGPDVGCSVIAKEGEVLAYTIQEGIISSHKPFNSPAVVKFVQHQGVIDSIRKLVQATRWSGVVNFDLVIDGETNEPKVLEANPRYWRSLLGSLVAGVNFPYIACLVSEGCKVTDYAYRGIRYAKPDAALGFLVGSWFGQNSRRATLEESGLLYLLRDPIPDIAIQLKRLRPKSR